MNVNGDEGINKYSLVDEYGHKIEGCTKAAFIMYTAWNIWKQRNRRVSYIVTKGRTEEVTLRKMAW